MAAARPQTPPSPPRMPQERSSAPFPGLPREVPPGGGGAPERRRRRPQSWSRGGRRGSSEEEEVSFEGGPAGGEEEEEEEVTFEGGDSDDGAASSTAAASVSASSAASTPRRRPSAQSLLDGEEGDSDGDGDGDGSDEGAGGGPRYREDRPHRRRRQQQHELPHYAIPIHNVRQQRRHPPKPRRPQQARHALVLDGGRGGRGGQPQPQPPPQPQPHQHQHPHQLQLPPRRYARSAASDPTGLLAAAGSTDMVKKIFRAASAARRSPGHPAPGGGGSHPPPSSAPPAAETALQFARGASIAGYLGKLGTAVPGYKRRFFVLRPSTLLYYFVGPDDAEPRGCIDLDECDVVGEVAAGAAAARGADSASDAGSASSAPGPDASSAAAAAAASGGGGEGGGEGQGGFRFEIVLREEGGRGDGSHQGHRGSRRRIVLEARTEEARREWMHRLRTDRLPLIRAELEESRAAEAKLTEQVNELEADVENMRVHETERDKAQDEARGLREQLASLDGGVRLLTRSMLRMGEDGNGKEGGSGDDDGDDDVDNRGARIDKARRAEEEERLLELSVPGTGFGALRNAAEQLRSGLAQTSREADVALRDSVAAADRAADLEERLAEAEARAQRLELENVSLKEECRRRKRDHKILVKEVRNLRAEVEATEARTEEAVAEAVARATEEAQMKSFQSKNLKSEETSRLMVELEGHVAATLKLQQKLLSATKSSNDDQNSNGGDDNDPVKVLEKLRLESGYTGSRSEGSTGVSSDDGEANMPAIAVDEEENEASVNETLSPLAPTKLLLGDSANAGSLMDDESEGSEEAVDQSDTDEAEEGPSRPLVTIAETGAATSRLTSSLADLSSTKNAKTQSMYHLTFHSKKIGLQFQKVPAFKSKRGLLSSAMDDDDNLDENQSELERIAAIARRAKANEASVIGEEGARVAMPVDAVLVCGFFGFDSNANRTPDLGARLVGFDGMSVEIGEWTFDKIRKGIQSRARPITLSFRNDLLSTEQKLILTKAILDVERSVPPPRPVFQYKGPEDDEMSVRSFRSTTASLSVPASPSGTSIASHLSSNSYPYRNGDRGQEVAVGNDSAYQSFSDIRKSSSVASSTISSSLVSGLMNSLGKKVEKEKSKKYKPRYMREESESLNSRRHHQEFTASLL